MPKQTPNQQKRKAKTNASRKQSRRYLQWIIPAVALIFVIGIIYSNMSYLQRASSEPSFQKHGTLTFLNQENDPLIKIDIEIADDELEQARGLMWRTQMESTQGMLFIMDKLEEQSFWMLNTYIPLDIIFADANQQIVKIRANTQPKSLDQITSEFPALYVIEVVAGFCKQHNISEGDRFEFTQLQ